MTMGKVLTQSYVNLYNDGKWKEAVDLIQKDCQVAKDNIRKTYEDSNGEQTQ